MNLFLFLAQAQTAPQTNAASSLLGSPIILMIALFAIMYVVLIRPQQKQKKELRKTIQALAPGQKIVTIGGVHGIVHHKGDQTVKVKVSEGTILEFDLQAIKGVSAKD